MEELDHLQQAKYCIDRATCATSREAVQAQAQLAIANASVAQVELLAALLERLDMLTEFEGGKALYVALTK